VLFLLPGIALLGAAQVEDQPEPQGSITPAAAVTTGLLTRRRRSRA
jgi:hypothetical protein